MTSKKIRLPELSFSASCSITLFPAFGSDDVPARALPLRIAFGEPSKSSNAQTICINYTKGLTDEQVQERVNALGGGGNPLL